MNPTFFERLLRYAGFHGGDLALLREIHPRVRGAFPTIVDDFYARILQDDVTRRILSDTRRVEFLKASLRRWLDDVFVSERDSAYLAWRRRIGFAHVSIDLPAAYTFVAMNHIRCQLEIEIEKNSTTSESLGVRCALGRALDLELALISESYAAAEHYRDVVETAPEMIHAADRSGRFLQVNQTEATVLGYSRETLLSMSLKDLVLREDLPALERHLESVFTSGEGQCEVRLRTARNDIMTVEILATAKKDAVTQEFEVARAYVRDITARRNAEFELRRERELERRFLEVAGVMIVLLDTDFKVTLTNARACETLGRSEAEVLGSSWPEIAFLDADRESLRNTLKRVLNGSAAPCVVHEHALLTADQAVCTVEWRSTAIENETGQRVGVLCSGLDITDSRRLLRELMEKENLARLGEMAAVVAHEVRNPLAGIAGAIQVIGDALPTDGKEREVVREILDRIGALNAIVTDLLLFARPRSPRPEATDLRRLVDDTLALVQRDAAFSELTVEVRGKDVLARCDPELIKPAVLNLLMNAAQAPGTRRITISLRSGTSSSTIEVKDDGSGIPASIRERVFEPFFSTKHRGTGLGLSIARRLVTAQGGQISLECPGSGGTIVRIQLPLSGGD